MKIELYQCGKAKCGHVLLGSEQVWVPSRISSWSDSKTGTCPKCGNESFWQLNSQGQQRKMSDESPREIDPRTIEPSPRMGLKMKRRILAAKRRALAEWAVELEQEFNQRRAADIADDQGQRMADIGVLQPEGGK